MREQHTYPAHLEGPDGVVGELLDLDERDGELTERDAAHLRPVLVALGPALLHDVGQHDDAGGLLLPHHPPEVLCGVGQRTLRGDVAVLLLVALQRGKAEAVYKTVGRCYRWRIRDYYSP